jgi:UDP-N-acetylmuramate dehydrogenase
MKPVTQGLSATSPLGDLGAIVTEGESLARHTWYRIGGPAKYFVRPRSVEELSAVVRRCRENLVPVYFLGKGANLLVSDAGVDGAVVRLSEPAWESMAINGDVVKVGAGADMARLVVDTCRAGLSGLECMAGIPGTVGGVVRMNAGGKFGDFGTSVMSLELMDEAGKAREYAREEVAFHYRHADLPVPYVLSATVRLEPTDPDELARKMREIWMYKRNSQPLNAKSAGCVFKNPAPEASGGRSAGALIDQAGLKGTRVGGAFVSTMHANFFTADPGTKAAEVLALIARVEETVERRFGVKLQREVQVWG